MREKHKHDFVPVDVTWKNYWIVKERKPNHVVLACSCGKVKLVDATLVKNKVTLSEVIENE